MMSEGNEDQEILKDNVYLFPKMLDHYQIQLTRMLEAEQFGEAKELLRFLLQCQGEDERHYEEWKSLLHWIEMAFPEGQGTSAQVEDPETLDEQELRSRVLQRERADNSDEAYIAQVLHIMREHPLIEQQLLALERAVYLEGNAVDESILAWITEADLHPSVQFKALQALRRRGVTGMIAIDRQGELVEAIIEDTPLSMDEFPPSIMEILERVENVTEVSDPTLPHFARELWKECLQALYGTSEYKWMLEGGEDTIDCWAAALHQGLQLVAYGSSDDEEIRHTYGIPESLRFRYEQAGKAIRRVGVADIVPTLPEQP
jgi:hypothetical protein